MSFYTVNNFSSKKYEGHIRDYFSWLESVHNLLDAEGLKFTIVEAGGNGYIPCPHMAVALINRLNNGTADEKDHRMKDQILRAATEYQSSCRKALMIVTSTLGVGPLSRTENTRIHPQSNVDSKMSILKTMADLKSYYGTWSPYNQQTITDKMYQLDPAKTPAEVEKLARMLTRINGELRALKEDCALSDASLKARLIEDKMHCERLRPLFEQIADEDNQAWSYDVCMTKLNKKIDSLATIAALSDELTTIPPPLSPLPPVHLSFTSSPTDAFAAAAHGNAVNSDRRPPRDGSKPSVSTAE